MNNEIRFLIRNATIAPDGLLVTKGDSNIFVPGEPKEKIIVPHNVAPGTLYHMHNSRHFVTHPSQNQLSIQSKILYLESATSAGQIVRELLHLLHCSETAKANDN